MPARGGRCGRRRACCVVFGLFVWEFVEEAVVGLVSVAFQDKAVGCVDKHTFSREVFLWNESAFKS